VPRSTHGALVGALASVGVAAMIALVGAVAGASASSYPILPLADDRGFLGNLSAPSLTPGTSGSISFTVGNPLSATMTSVELGFQVYAFNAFPGNATSTVSVAGAPVLSNATASGGSVNLSIGTLPTHGSVPGSVSVATSASTPSGTFAVRTSLTFVANATAYRLDSRGWFTEAQWAQATELPNGSATLNLTVLGVSGVLPETGVLVEPSSWSWILFGVLAAAAVFVGVGAWIYFRRGPSSSSGIRSADDDHQAPRAFGSKRTRDGD
jgi:hypothetical protein